jgi:hypothetical protein
MKKLFTLLSISLLLSLASCSTKSGETSTTTDSLSISGDTLISVIDTVNTVDTTSVDTVK